VPGIRAQRSCHQMVHASRHNPPLIGTGFPGCLGGSNAEPADLLHTRIRTHKQNAPGCGIRGRSRASEIGVPTSLESEGVSRECGRARGAPPAARMALLRAERAAGRACRQERRWCSWRRASCGNVR